MIWLDSSYIIARLLGEPRAAFEVPLGTMFVLPAQLAECHIFFRKADMDTAAVTATLQALPIHQTTFAESLAAARLYMDARKNERSKASLADALLAAAVHATSGRLLTFDDDFAKLGMKKRGELWVPR